MSHDYVILSDSEESLETLFDAEVYWRPGRFGATFTLAVSGSPGTRNFWQSLEGFFISLRFI